MVVQPLVTRPPIVRATSNPIARRPQKTGRLMSGTCTESADLDAVRAGGLRKGPPPLVPPPM